MHYRYLMAAVFIGIGLTMSSANAAAAGSAAEFPVQERGGATFPDRDILFSQGMENVRDPKMAYKTILEAHNLGCVAATRELGYRNEAGLGVSKKDMVMAVFYYRTAAEANDIEANFHCGRLSYSGYTNPEGKLVGQDLGKAIKHYTAAANVGHVLAQFNLGTIYPEAPAQIRAISEAFAHANGLKYLNLAADNGHEEAEKGLVARLADIERKASVGDKVAQEVLKICADRAAAATAAARSLPPALPLASSASSSSAAAGHIAWMPPS